MKKDDHCHLPGEFRELAHEKCNLDGQKETMLHLYQSFSNTFLHVIVI